MHPTARGHRQEWVQVYFGNLHGHEFKTGVEGLEKPRRIRVVELGYIVCSCELDSRTKSSYKNGIRAKKGIREITEPLVLPRLPANFEQVGLDFFGGPVGFGGGVGFGEIGERLG